MALTRDAMKNSRDIVAIDKSNGVALQHGGAVLPVARWVGWNGEDCERQEAKMAVVGPDAFGLWYTLNLEGFKEASIH